VYALFPLLLSALGAGMLGAWLVHEAGMRAMHGLALPGWLLIAVLPLVLLGLLAGGATWGGPASSAVPLALLSGAGGLLICAGIGAAVVRLRARAAAPGGRGFLGPTLVIPAIAAISLCFVLSLLLALTNGTLASRP
jgi:hypothetical protein